MRRGMRGTPRKDRNYNDERRDDLYNYYKYIFPYARRLYSVSLIPRQSFNEFSEVNEGHLSLRWND